MASLQFNMASGGVAMATRLLSAGMRFFVAYLPAFLFPQPIALALVSVFGTQLIFSFLAGLDSWPAYIDRHISAGGLCKYALGRQILLWLSLFPLAAASSVVAFRDQFGAQEMAVGLVFLYCEFVFLEFFRIGSNTGMFLLAARMQLLKNLLQVMVLLIASSTLYFVENLRVTTLLLLLSGCTLLATVLYFVFSRVSATGAQYGNAVEYPPLRIVPTSLAAALVASFDRLVVLATPEKFGLPELRAISLSGVGFGVTALLLFSDLFMRFNEKGDSSNRRLLRFSLRSSAITAAAIAALIPAAIYSGANIEYYLAFGVAAVCVTLVTPIVQVKSRLLQYKIGLPSLVVVVLLAILFLMKLGIMTIYFGLSCFLITISMFALLVLREGRLN